MSRCYFCSPADCTCTVELQLSSDCERDHSPAGRAHTQSAAEPLVPYPDGASHELLDGAAAEGSQSTVRTRGTGTNAAVRSIPAHANKHKHSVLVLQGHSRSTDDGLAHRLTVHKVS